MLTKSEVAVNLRKFAQDNFKSIAELGRKLEMRQQNLQIYFEGRSYPGGQVLGRLSELGCDITWLLTGEVRKEKYIPSEELIKVGSEQGRMYRAIDYIPKDINEINKEHEAGRSESKESIYYDSNRYVFINVTSKNSLAIKPLINKGDKALIDLESEAADKDIVVVKYESGVEEIRILALDSENKGMVMLLSINPTIPPICKKRKLITMHRIVLIKRK